MAQRTGSADLPLHAGHVPLWLASRMARLGRVIVEAVVLTYGQKELLRRLAHPFWFQAFGAVMGMDWHSSGVTTSVLGALKRGLADAQWELGIHVCGGRGRHSRRTPEELVELGSRLGFDGERLAATSRLVAKVDSAAVQDGYDLYLHGFVVTDEGSWAVVQQGMDPAQRRARRYHWLSEGLSSFVEEPHTAIEGEPEGTILNLTDRRAGVSREAVVALTKDAPEKVVGELLRLREAEAAHPGNTALATQQDPEGPRLVLPERHAVAVTDVFVQRLRGTLLAARERGPRDFQDLLLVPGVGPRTVAALALVAEVIHGAPCRFSDPARFSFAHGGKDGHPFPVPLHVYDHTIAVLKEAVARARLGQGDKLAAIRRLDEEARRLEVVAKGGGFERLVAAERARAPLYGGRTVFDDAHETPRHTSGNARAKRIGPRAGKQMGLPFWGKAEGRGGRGTEG